MRSKGGLAFFALALAFVLIAFLPVFRGESLNAAFLSLAVVFFVLAIAAGRRRPPGA